MNRFTDVDLSSLPSPDAIEVLSLEDIIDAIKTTYLGLTADDDDVPSDFLESDPAVKLMETAGLREILLRQRVNEAVRAVLLASSTKADLDHLGADKLTQRLVLDPGDPDAVPPVPPTMESDDAFRSRIQLAWEALSTAGPSGAYVYHALSADASIIAVTVQEPEPVEVLITVQTADNDGIASEAVLAAVTAALADDRTARPLSDQVTVQAASAVDFTVEAAIYVEPGPDSLVVLDAATASLDSYLSDRGLLGRPVTRSGVSAALSVTGVWNVVLTEPAADVEPSLAEFGNPTSVDVTIGGVG